MKSAFLFFMLPTSDTPYYARMRRYAAQIGIAVLSTFVWAFVVLIPVHVSFAYTHATPEYQLYQCNGYISYSPCPQPYYYYPTTYYYPYYEYYYYPQYFDYSYYYPAYGYGYAANGNSNQNYNYNTNLNYTYNGGYYWY